MTLMSAGAYGLIGKIFDGGRLRDDEIYFADGGATICRWPWDNYPDFFCTNVLGDITIAPPSPGDLYFAHREDYLIFTVPAINYYGRPHDPNLQCDILGTETFRQFPVPYTIKEIAENPDWGGPGVYAFVVGSRSLNNLCDGNCQHKEKSFTIFDVKIKDPHGNPELDPADAGANQTNELTFSIDPAPNAFINIFCEALPIPNTQEVRTLLEDNKIRWSVTELVGSNLSWNVAWPNDNTKGEGLEVIATFEGMPGLYSSFGLKEVKLEYLDGGQSLFDTTTNVQVFYPRDGSNNPQGTVPNWFYYWKQVHPNSNETYDQYLSIDGEAPGMRDWRYHISPDKNSIIIGPSASEEGSSYGFGRFFTGIDKFISVVIHEETHVDQIQRADPLVPSSGDDSFRYGWSWNTDIYYQRHNHWSKGIDNEWGIAGIDDDHNQITDDAAPIPNPIWQFEPGYGRSPVEENLNHPNWADWPNVWPLPSPLYPVGPIESEAINASDNAIPENGYYSGSDWGDPGKQHKNNGNYKD